MTRKYLHSQPSSVNSSIKDYQSTGFTLVLNCFFSVGATLNLSTMCSNKHVFERGIAKCVCTTGEQYTTLLEKKSITVKWINSSFRIQIQEWVNNKKRKSKKPPQHGQNTLEHVHYCYGLFNVPFSKFTSQLRSTTRQLTQQANNTSQRPQ